MEDKELGKIPIHDFLDKVIESDSLLNAIRKEREESLKGTTDQLEQRKEILQKLLKKKIE